MDELRCCVDIGIHIGPYWREVNKGMLVCSRHRVQYDERSDDLGPFTWRVVVQCIKCDGRESKHWWKCCPTHTTEQGDDLVCDTCVAILHKGHSAPPLVELNQLFGE